MNLQLNPIRFKPAKPKEKSFFKRLFSRFQNTKSEATPKESKASKEKVGIDSTNVTRTIEDVVLTIIPVQMRTIIHKKKNLRDIIKVIVVELFH